MRFHGGWKTVALGRVAHKASVETLVRPDLHADGEAMRAKGSFDLSLAAIGSDVVKGPLGAFRVKDRVRVSFDAVFVPAASI